MGKILDSEFRWNGEKYYCLIEQRKLFFPVHFLANMFFFFLDLLRVSASFFGSIVRDGRAQNPIGSSERYSKRIPITEIDYCDRVRVQRTDEATWPQQKRICFLPNRHELRNSVSLVRCDQLAKNKIIHLHENHFLFCFSDFFFLFHP